jgi:ribonuclease T1
LDKAFFMLRNGGGKWRQVLATVLLVVFAASAGLIPSVVQAKTPFTASAGTIALSDLPPEGRNLMALIYRGGPFRYDKDGTVFGNRERILPARNRGYYREYTVRTPSERSRGARRIICGGVKPASPDACYYTDDHYASFRQIVQ